jgi:cobalt-precorrin 5A hydrolase/precorrin-3B C17-methyltransferase
MPSESTVPTSRSLVVGLGWSGQPVAELLERAVRAVFQQHGLSLEAVRLLATLERKGRDPALAALLARLGWPLRLYSVGELRVAHGLTLRSEQVERYVGTPTVAEAAALCGAGASTLLLRRQVVREGAVSVTLAVAFAAGGEAA